MKKIVACWGPRRGDHLHQFAAGSGTFFCLKELLKDVAKHIAELKAGVAKVTKNGQDPRTAAGAELSAEDGVNVIIGDRALQLAWRTTMSWEN